MFTSWEGGRQGWTEPECENRYYQNKSQNPSYDYYFYES